TLVTSVHVLQNFAFPSNFFVITFARKSNPRDVRVRTIGEMRMATGGVELTTETARPANDLMLRRVHAEQVVKSGANWFVWIAGLSVVNSIVGMSGGHLHFIFGLGITQIVDALAHQAGSAGMFLDLII